MGRLTNLRPVVTTMAPMVRRPVDAEGHGGEAWRGWYKLARWKRLRLAIFVRDLFTCQMEGCGRIEGSTALLVCDHVKRHGGDERLFWDARNLQTLCKPCHDSRKQREERAAGLKG